MGIKYHPNIRLLGIQFWSTLRQSTNATWSHLTGQVCLYAKESYQRDLCIAHRITYVHAYLIARLWYVAQVLPAPRKCTQRITSAINLFILKGNIFRVPINILQSPKIRGGWELLDIYAKCKALLLSRMLLQNKRDDSGQAALFRKWNIDTHPANPPNDAAYPNSMIHLREYATDMAYVPEAMTNETTQKTRKLIYQTIHITASAATTARPCRVETQHPNINWNGIWNNLHTAWIPDTVRSQWYLVLHELLPTKERLHETALADTHRCTTCGQVDTLSHRLIDCGEGKKYGAG
jgi:hypothetical protein